GVLDELGGGPARRLDAATQIIDLLVRDLDAERPDPGCSLSGGAHDNLPWWHLLSAERFESGAHLLAEELRLLPPCQVAAPVDFVEVDEAGVGLLDPAPGRLIRLVGKDAHGDGDGDAFRIPKAALVLPIEPRRRDPGVREPEQRDVVEDVVTGQLAGVAGGTSQ